jgi:hypothetical protein
LVEHSFVLFNGTSNAGLYYALTLIDDILETGDQSFFAGNIDVTS